MGKRDRPIGYPQKEEIINRTVSYRFLRDKTPGFSHLSSNAAGFPPNFPSMQPFNPNLASSLYSIIHLAHRHYVQAFSSLDPFSSLIKFIVLCITKRHAIQISTRSSAFVVVRGIEHIHNKHSLSTMGDVCINSKNSQCARYKTSFLVLAANGLGMSGSFGSHTDASLGKTAAPRPFMGLLKRRMSPFFPSSSLDRLSLLFPFCKRTFNNPMGPCLRRRDRMGVLHDACDPSRWAGLNMSSKSHRRR